ncbi:hypothetical protein DFP73DRAFT_616637 [Morchella snyderi]|nr:hypothetical protein DFP73DRAFT_616637 [Morchella snyderi]
MNSSPLMNSTTAKIFCHFVYVLGPSLSLFERQPPNPHVAFTPGAGLQGPQNVWSYTIPMLSLSHPPLMHAILALSSLHISKLTKGPSHPSLLHYHIALRRLGKSIASDKHRGHVATLSATLLLGYYETMAAEHDKWSSHIHGAKQLLKEIDFDRVARRVEILDEQDRISQQQQQRDGSSPGGEEHLQAQGQLWPPPTPQPGQQPSMLRLRKMRKQQVYNDADENFASMLSGHGRAARNRGARRGGQQYHQQQEGGGEGGTATSKELDEMQLQADMFWWFAKMDCYQSLVSGCPLVLDYIYWSQCPPRARIGTLGMSYGSSDHYFLLLGRLCAFQEKDLKRKKAVQRANGGMWIPPPELGGPPRGMGAGRGAWGMGRGGMQGPPPGWTGPPPPGWGGGGPPQGMGMGGPPNGMSGPPGMGFSGGLPGGMGPPHGPPNGMGPPNGPPRVPQAFAQNFPELSHENEQRHYSQDEPPEDLTAATLEAEREWSAIQHAFHVFQQSLGEEYQPLPIEYMPVQNTPFGAAIYYRTYSIATLQMLYYMAMIVLERCHPSMPAVTMMAAGIAAPKTARIAIDIARITAGLVPTDPNGQINPALGAGLIESSMPLFFAAVQYQEQAQRDWVVRKLREITRLTGWATASRVLLGCQRAWERAAEMGKGPRYERPPFEEEGEFFYEWNLGAGGAAAVMSTEAEAGSGEGSGRYLWRSAGRRLAGAVGILGPLREDLGVGELRI